MPDNDILWQVSSLTQLRWQVWGEEYIVYNAASGQTHYLNKFAADVLQYFEGQPASLAKLISDADVAGASGDTALDLVIQLRQLVDDFDSVGLIVPVAS